LVVEDAVNEAISNDEPLIVEDGVNEAISNDEPLVVEDAVNEAISDAPVEFQITPAFLDRITQAEDIFPINQPKPDPSPKKISCEINEKILLYIAEIVNLECHHSIKCSKYKLGYIIRERMSPSHKSRITHTDPFANFYWFHSLLISLFIYS
jgi:hypothetical protein